MLAPALLALLAAASPRAEVHPPRARPGDVVVVEVRAAKPPSAALGGRALHFFPAGRGRFRAYAGLPVETPLGLATVEGVGFRAPLEVVDPRWRESKLTVPPVYTEPERPPELDARIAADRAAFAAAFAEAPRPPLFRRPFTWPRKARVTGRFGDRRTFNGETKGQHYGTDLAGQVGAWIGAANDGEVVLVRDAWAPGLSVVLFHGANLFTVYFHLSRADVKEGDRVVRGQRIGLLGGSGRATGPHLHWGARVGDLYVDPESLLAATAVRTRAARTSRGR